MIITAVIKEYIDRSVLCWLATASSDNIPNVSPKEIFTYFGDHKVIIANIASPQSLRNIQQNENVCLSFIDVLVQKGFQLKGTSRIIQRSDPEYLAMEKVLLKMTGGAFPFSSIIEIVVDQAKPIIAPKYILYPDTTESEQIESARKVYGFKSSP